MGRKKGTKNKIKVAEASVKAPQSPEIALYSMVLQLNDKEYKAEGNELEQMFLTIKPECFKTRGILKLKKGDKEVMRYLNIPQLKRIFGYGGANTQKIAMGCTIKYLKLMLGE